MQSRVWPQNSSTAQLTRCAAVLHDPVTKTDLYKVQHVFVEGPSKLYRSPEAAEVRFIFPDAG